MKIKNLLFLGLLAVVLLGLFAMPAYAERFADRGYGFRMHNGGVCADRIAEVLGMTREEVLEVRERGSSLYELAAEKGMDEEDFIQEISEAKKARIDSLVEDGIITEEEAAVALENFGGLHRRFSQGCGLGMGHHGFRRGRDN